MELDFQEFQFDDSVQYSVNLEEDETFQDWCARRIQAWWRGRKTRRSYMKLVRSPNTSTRLHYQ